MLRETIGREPSHFREEVSRPSHFREEVSRPSHFREEVSRPSHFEEVSRPRSLVALLLTLAAGLAACTSYPLPVTPDKAMLEQVRSTTLPLSIGVVPGRIPFNAQRLVEALRRTELFERVELTTVLPHPDLVARVEDDDFASQVPSACFLGLTLGLIPVSWAEHYGHRFSLWRPGSSGSGLMVDFIYEGRTQIGLLALIRNAGPRRTHRPPTLTERYDEALAAKILTQRDAIEALIAN